MVVPYIRGIFRKICRIIKEFGICTTFRLQTVLWSILTKTKPKNEIWETENCIYNIPCKCRKKYMGDHLTPESLNTRMGEISKSKVTEHSWDDGNRIQWNKAEIIHKEEKRIIRNRKESVFNRTGHVNQAYT
jgi:hypothetical protein